MLASPLYHQKTRVRPPSFLSSFSQRTLAVVLLIAFAVLGSFAGKESETSGSVFDRNANRNVRPPCQNGRSATVTGLRAQKSASSLSALAAMDSIGKVVKNAFNDPHLIEYASEQGIPDSMAVPPSSILSQPSTYSGSRPIQSR